ncbi:MAG: hypothetical protein KC618_06775 [Candidatus Omnitrophica bacterium]|nr:hypothetical protein [Candidatus Omnitrophota bacterium]
MRKIVTGIIIASFVFAILCSLCSGMMGMAHAGEMTSAYQQHSKSMEHHPCCPFNKSDNCKCLDLNGVEKPEVFKKQVFTGKVIKFSKIFSSLTGLDSNLLSFHHSGLSYHSPPQKNIGSTPVFILNHVLRL